MLSDMLNNLGIMVQCGQSSSHLSFGWKRLSSLDMDFSNSYVSFFTSPELVVQHSFHFCYAVAFEGLIFGVTVVTQPACSISVLSFRERSDHRNPIRIIFLRRENLVLLTGI